MYKYSVCTMVEMRSTMVKGDFWVWYDLFESSFEVSKGGGGAAMLLVSIREVSQYLNTLCS